MRGSYLTPISMMITIAGCGAHHDGSQFAASRDSDKRIVSLSQNNSPTPDGPRDAQPSVPIVFRLQTYQLCLPAGTISRNDAFWKRINEQCLDPLTYENLWGNGIRVGIAPIEEWEHLNNLIQQNPGTASHVDTVGRDAKNIELEMAKGVPYQTVTYIDLNNEPHGRSYDRCENIINLCYQPTPRKVGSARISLAPMVRTMRKRLEFSPANNEEREIVYKSDESFYLNIVVDVPANHILVVAPSSDVKNETSLGSTFLTKDEPAERFEQVILIFPRPTRVEPAQQ